MPSAALRDAVRLRGGRRRSVGHVGQDPRACRARSLGLPCVLAPSAPGAPRRASGVSAASACVLRRSGRGGGAAGRTRRGGFWCLGAPGLRSRPSAASAARASVPAASLLPTGCRCQEPVSGSLAPGQQRSGCRGRHGSRASATEAQGKRSDRRARGTAGRGAAGPWQCPQAPRGTGSCARAGRSRRHRMSGAAVGAGQGPALGAAIRAGPQRTWGCGIVGAARPGGRRGLRETGAGRGRLGRGHSCRQ